VHGKKGIARIPSKDVFQYSSYMHMWEGYEIPYNYYPCQSFATPSRRNDKAGELKEI
jgi:hypothetical protein